MNILNSWSDLRAANKLSSAYSLFSFCWRRSSTYTQTSKEFDVPGCNRLDRRVESDHRAGRLGCVHKERAHGVTNDKGELDLPGYSPALIRFACAPWDSSTEMRSVIVSARGNKTLRVTQQATTDEATLHYQRGDALRDKGRNKDAVEEYKLALALKNSAEVRIAMARTLTTLQDFQEAEKHIQAAIKLGGRTIARGSNRAGESETAPGLVEESIFEYRKALRLAHGNSFEAHIGLAIALNEQEKVDEAEIEGVSNRNNSGHGNRADPVLPTWRNPRESKAQRGGYRSISQLLAARSRRRICFCG